MLKEKGQARLAGRFIPACHPTSGRLRMRPDGDPAHIVAGGKRRALVGVSAPTAAYHQIGDLETFVERWSGKLRQQIGAITRCGGGGAAGDCLGVRIGVFLQSFMGVKVPV